MAGGRKPNVVGMQWVEKALALQLSHTEIANKASEKFRCTPRTVHNWIAKAYARMETQAINERPMRRHQMVESLRMLYQEALQHGDYRAGVQCLDRISKLWGIYQDVLTVKAEVAVAVIDVRSMSPGARREEIDRLIEARKLAQDGTQAGPALLEAPVPTSGSGGNGAGNGRGNGHG